MDWLDRLVEQLRAIPVGNVRRNAHYWRKVRRLLGAEINRFVALEVGRREKIEYEEKQPLSQLIRKLDDNLQDLTKDEIGQALRNAR